MEPTKRKKLFIVVRVQDYRITALAGDADTPEFADFGDSTLISDDREEMFQLGREHGGLLCAADGVPTVAGVKPFALKRANIQVLANAMHHEPEKPTSSPDPAEPDALPL